jgi:hypothetical protein
MEKTNQTNIRRLKGVETNSYDTLQEEIKVRNQGTLELLSLTGKWCTDGRYVAS